MNVNYVLNAKSIHHAELACHQLREGHTLNCRGCTDLEGIFFLCLMAVKHHSLLSKPVNS